MQAVLPVELIDALTPLITSAHERGIRRAGVFFSDLVGKIATSRSNRMLASQHDYGAMRFRNEDIPLTL